VHANQMGARYRGTCIQDTHVDWWENIIRLLFRKAGEMVEMPNLDCQIDCRPWIAVWRPWARNDVWITRETLLVDPVFFLIMKTHRYQVSEFRPDPSGNMRINYCGVQ
jgi:hypothetical protein